MTSNVFYFYFTNFTLYLISNDKGADSSLSLNQQKKRLRDMRHSQKIFVV